MNESLLFDASVRREDDVVVLTFSSADFDEGLTLRMTQQQGHQLRERLDIALVVPIDTDEIARLVAEADWKDEGGGTFRAYNSDDTISNVLRWECGTCREDVGWAAHSEMDKDEDGRVTLYVECGHCGYQMYFDTNGDQLDDR